jgi:hypothetical protein
MSRFLHHADKSDFFLVSLSALRASVVKIFSFPLFRKGIPLPANYSMINTTFEYLNLYLKSECLLSTRSKLL